MDAAFRGCMAEAEQQILETKDVQKDHTADIHTLKVKVKHLEYCAEDAENCNRRNKLLIVGLMEGAEEANQFSSQFTVESLSYPTCQGPSWDLVLWVAQTSRDLRYENAKLMVFPDYSMETQHLRNTLDHICSCLRTKI